MKAYEAICLFNPKTEEEKLEALLNKIQKKIESGGGTIEKIDKWGRKRLAFTFQTARDLKEAIYIAIFFKSEPKIAKELENILKVTEEIVRFQVLLSKKKEEETAGVEKLEVKAEEKVEISASLLKGSESGQSE